MDGHMWHTVSGYWHQLWDLRSFWDNLLRLGAPQTAVSLAEKVVRPAVVYAALVYALRHFGQRMLAQLNPFDFVVLLTLSNTVQNAIIGNDTSLVGGLVGAASLIGVNAILVRYYYRGPTQESLIADRDIPLISGGRLAEPELARLHINRAELTAQAHERGFDALSDVDSAVLYPNGTIYFRGRHPDEDERRHRAIMERLDHLQRELAALRG